MLGNLYQTSFHIPGTLSANIALRWAAARDCTLIHISAGASNDSDARLVVGTSADADGFLTSSTIGDAGPAAFDLDNFNGALLSNPGSEYPYIAAGTVISADLDFDGSSGTAAQNVTLVFTFLEA